MKRVVLIVAVAVLCVTGSAVADDNGGFLGSGNRSGDQTLGSGNAAGQMMGSGGRAEDSGQVV